MTNPVAPPSITAPPADAPDSTNISSFQTRADAWVAWMKTFFTTDVQAFLTNCYTNAVSALENATAAAGSASASATSASAAASSLSSMSAALGLTITAVTGTTQAATAGNLYVLQNVAATTVTLPAAPANGAVVGVMAANGLTTNIVARNGKQINGLSEDLVIDMNNASILLRYIDATSQWRII